VGAQVDDVGDLRPGERVGEVCGAGVLVEVHPQGLPGGAVHDAPDDAVEDGVGDDVGAQRLEEHTDGGAPALRRVRDNAGVRDDLRVGGQLPGGLPGEGDAGSGGGEQHAQDGVVFRLVRDVAVVQVVDGEHERHPTAAEGGGEGAGVVDVLDSRIAETEVEVHQIRQFRVGQPVPPQGVECRAADCVGGVGGRGHGDVVGADRCGVDVSGRDGQDMQCPDLATIRSHCSPLFFTCRGRSAGPPAHHMAVAPLCLKV
jgi:hypothetical protein